MKKIFVINDETAGSKKAAIDAFEIAKRVEADLVFATVVKKNGPESRYKKKVLIGYENDDADNEKPLDTLGIVGRQDTGEMGYNPKIEIVDFSSCKEEDVIPYITKNNVWMIIKGMSPSLGNNEPVPGFDIHRVLNSVNCPLLLLPAEFNMKQFERMVYITDLRYCKQPVVSFMIKFAAYYQANALINHLTFNGLTDLNESYATDLVNDLSCSVAGYSKLFFNHLKEKNVLKALDVIINGMNADLLMLVNNEYHFNQVVGGRIAERLPEYLTVPLFVFPC